MDFRRFPERARVRHRAGKRGCGSGFGRDEIDPRVRCPTARLEVAVEGAQGNAAGLRGEAHSDAGAAGAFKDARAGVDEIGECAAFREHRIHLFRAGRDGKAYVRMDGFSLENCRDGEQIEHGGIRAGADADLIDFHAGKLCDRANVARAVRTCGKRDKRGKIDGICLVINGVRVRRERNEICFSVLRREKGARHFIRREKRACRAELRTHVGDGRALGDGQR